MSAFSFWVGGHQIAGDWQVGQLPDGSSWARVETSAATAVSPHDRVDVLDDKGRHLWTGVVRRVSRGSLATTIDINDLTAVTMAHRVTTTGEPDPHFRYGDVIRYRDRSVAVNDDRYMVVKRRPWTTDEYEVIGLTGRGRGKGFDIGESDWELAE